MPHPFRPSAYDLACGARYSAEACGNSVSIYYSHGNYHVIGYNQDKGRTFWAVLPTFKQGMKVYRGYKRLVTTNRLQHLQGLL